MAKTHESKCGTHIIIWRGSRIFITCFQSRFDNTYDVFPVSLIWESNTTIRHAVCNWLQLVHAVPYYTDRLMYGIVQHWETCAFSCYWMCPTTSLSLYEVKLNKSAEAISISSSCRRISIFSDQPERCLQSFALKTPHRCIPTAGDAVDIFFFYDHDWYGLSPVPMILGGPAQWGGGCLWTYHYPDWGHP